MRGYTPPGYGWFFILFTLGAFLGAMVPHGGWLMAICWVAAFLAAG